MYKRQVQEEQDDYFKEKMEEYRLFLERHPGYNDDGILLGDEMESNSEHDIVHTLFSCVY